LPDDVEIAHLSWVYIVQVAGLPACWYDSDFRMLTGTAASDTAFVNCYYAVISERSWINCVDRLYSLANCKVQVRIYNAVVLFLEACTVCLIVPNGSALWCRVLMFPTRNCMVCFISYSTLHSVQKVSYSFWTTITYC
jgi:hypothetical protein